MYDDIEVVVKWKEDENDKYKKNQKVMDAVKHLIHNTAHSDFDQGKGGYLTERKAIGSLID